MNKKEREQDSLESRYCVWYIIADNGHIGRKQNADLNAEIPKWIM